MSGQDKIYIPQDGRRSAWPPHLQETTTSMYVRAREMFLLLWFTPIRDIRSYYTATTTTMPIVVVLIVLKADKARRNNKLAAKTQKRKLPRKNNEGCVYAHQLL